MTKQARRRREAAESRQRMAHTLAELQSVKADTARIRSELLQTLAQLEALEADGS